MSHFSFGAPGHRAPKIKVRRKSELGVFTVICSRKKICGLAVSWGSRRQREAMKFQAELLCVKFKPKYKPAQKIIWNKSARSPLIFVVVSAVRSLSCSR